MEITQINLHNIASNNNNSTNNDMCISILLIALLTSPTGPIQKQIFNTIADNVVVALALQITPIDVDESQIL